MNEYEQTAYNLLVELSQEIHVGNLPYNENISEVIKYAKKAGLNDQQITNVKSYIKQAP